MSATATAPEPAKCGDVQTGFDGFSFDTDEKAQPYPVNPGEPVLWYPDADEHQEPVPAFVTRVGHGSILSVAILGPGYHNFMVREGVRHLRDPRAKDVEKRESGAWDYGWLHKRLQHVHNSMRELWKVLPAKR